MGLGGRIRPDTYSDEMFSNQANGNGKIVVLKTCSPWRDRKKTHRFSWTPKRTREGNVCCSSAIQFEFGLSSVIERFFGVHVRHRRQHLLQILKASRPHPQPRTRSEGASFTVADNLPKHTSRIEDQGLFPGRKRCSDIEETPPIRGKVVHLRRGVVGGDPD